MTKTMRSVSEDVIEQTINRQEEDGWQFVTAVQSSAAHTIIGEFSHHSYPATYLLFFRKADQTHNDVP